MSERLTCCKCPSLTKVDVLAIWKQESQFVGLNLHGMCPSQRLNAGGITIGENDTFDAGKEASVHGLILWKTERKLVVKMKGDRFSPVPRLSRECIR